MENKTWLDKGTDSIIEQNPLFANKTILKNAHKEKMSEVLLDLAMPLLDEIDKSNKGDVEAIIKAAVTAWNYSIIIDKTYPTNEFADRLNKKSAKAIFMRKQKGNIKKRMLTMLFERKESLYPDNKRIIGGFDIKWDDIGKEFHLTILSTD